MMKAQEIISLIREIPGANEGWSVAPVLPMGLDCFPFLIVTYKEKEMAVSATDEGALIVDAVCEFVGEPEDVFEVMDMAVGLY